MGGLISDESNQGDGMKAEDYEKCETMEEFIKLAIQEDKQYHSVELDLKRIDDEIESLKREREIVARRRKKWIAPKWSSYIAAKVSVASDCDGYKAK